MIVLILIVVVAYVSLNLFQIFYKPNNTRLKRKSFRKSNVSKNKAFTMLNNPEKWKLKLTNEQYTWYFDENALSNDQTLLERYHLGTDLSNYFKEKYENENAYHNITICIEKAIDFISIFQCPVSGHWPGDYSGPNFLIPCALFTQFFVYHHKGKLNNDQDNIFDVSFNAYKKAIICYIKNVAYPGGGWNFHHLGVQDNNDSDESYRFTTILYYVCLRLLGVSSDDKVLVDSLIYLKNQSSTNSRSLNQKDLQNEELVALAVPAWAKFLLSLIGLYEYDGMNTLFPELWYIARIDIQLKLPLLIILHNYLEFFEKKCCNNGFGFGLLSQPEPKASPQGKAMTTCVPEALPFHPSRMWCHCRQLYLPMAYCYGHRIALGKKGCPALPDIILELRKELYGSLENYDGVVWSAQRNNVDPGDVYTPHSKLLDLANWCLNLYERRPWGWLRARALSKMYEHVRADDAYTSFTSIAPISKSFNMIVRWHGDGPDSIAVGEHLKSFKYFWWIGPEGMRLMGTNGSQFWDTAFAVQALMHCCESNEITADSNECARKCITNAVVNYFMDQQTLSNPKDYQKYYRHPPKGGFPFSTKLCGWIVSDCTAEAIVVMSKIYASAFALDNYEMYLSSRNGEINEDNFNGPTLKERIYMAVDCLLNYQNSNGGVASYEKIRGPDWLELLDPAEVFSDIMVEHAYTECTGAACRALITFSHVFPTYRSDEVQSFIAKAIQFMLSKQRQDGSWEGSWGVCFTYGAWLTMEALGAFGKPYIYEEHNIAHPSIVKACDYLVSKQRARDGAWGEDFTSCTTREYVESVEGNVVQTSWALLALLSVRYPKGIVFEKGIEFLRRTQLQNGNWPEALCTGVFNKTAAIIYSNYKNIFPLWALTRYYTVYGGAPNRFRNL